MNRAAVIFLSALAQSALTLAQPSFRDIRAAPPAEIRQTLHFTLEGPVVAIEELGRILEGTLTDFVITTRLSDFRPAGKIRIVLLSDAGEFRRKTGIRQRGAAYGDRTVVTHEGAGYLNTAPAYLVPILLEDHLGRPLGPDHQWLAFGLAQLVAARRSGLDFPDARDRWRRLTRKVSPASESDVREKEPLSRTGEFRRRYQVSTASLVTFLVEWGGELNFGFFLNQLKAGKPLDEALSKAYPGRIRDFRELYAFWRKEEIGF